MKINGPGKYDDEATMVRLGTRAEGVALIVCGGDRGAGFAVQGSLQFVETLPDILEDVARSIRAQHAPE